MTSRIRSGIGAVLSGSAIALLYLNAEAWFGLPARPAVWMVALGGAAGLVGALLMRLLDPPRTAAIPAPAQPVEPGLPWQVNRLFLFNTLHNGAALTVADPEQARTVIEKLAEYLRLVHELNQRPDTMLNLEIRCAGMFLALERLRFGGRLHVSEEVAPECLESTIPSLVLQPLAAWAVRSGVELTDQPVKVALKAWQAGRVTLLEVRHNGPGLRDPARRQRLLEELGFPELERSLQQRWGERARLVVTADESSGEYARIRLPQVDAAG